jgi:hypothetical protein
MTSRLDQKRTKETKALVKLTSIRKSSNTFSFKFHLGPREWVVLAYYKTLWAHLDLGGRRKRLGWHNDQLRVLIRPQCHFPLLLSVNCKLSIYCKTLAVITTSTRNRAFRRKTSRIIQPRVL